MSGGFPLALLTRKNEYINSLRQLKRFSYTKNASVFGKISAFVYIASMKIHDQHEITFEPKEKVISTTSSKANEMIVLFDSGDVIRFDIQGGERQHLFSVKSSIGYSDGGFDLDAETKIYTLDEIVVVVNDYKRHGFIHYPENYEILRIRRGEYHADISRFPISLFKDEKDIPHIIYGVDWNHLQIMNLDSRQILTAAKSLIEEGAEERCIEFYKTHKEGNKLAWPSSYDYFYGELKLSPDQKHFLSAGWEWGSCDLHNIYNIEKFRVNPRIVDIGIGRWEHENRGSCWVDEETVVVPYSPHFEGDTDTDKDTPQEIHFYRLSEGKTELEKKVQVPGLDLMNAEVSFSKSLNAFVFIWQVGVAVVSLKGVLIYQNMILETKSFYPDDNLLLTWEDNRINIYQIRK